MGDNRLFWPQETMDEWIVQEQASIEDDVLTIVGEPIRYKLTQAVHFVADVGDGTDPHNLVGRVKELDTVQQNGWEHYMDSVLVEDSAYQVVLGFTGVPVMAEQEDRPSAHDITEAVAATGKDGDSDERELLAHFLLNNL